MAGRGSRRWPYIVCVVLQTVIFGAGNVFTKFAYESISPLWCLSIRFALATLVFFVFFGPRIVRQLRTVRLRDWLPAAVCMAATYLFCNVALSLTTATNVGFLVALPVVFTPLLAALTRRHRYSRALIPFQCVVVAGLYLLCSSGGSFSFGWGEAFAVLSSVSLAGALVFGESSLGKLDAVAVSGTQIGMAGILSFVCALVFEPPVDVMAVQPVAWGTIVFLALFSTCLTFALQNISLMGLPSSNVSMFLTGEPVFTALFSRMLLGETLTPIGLVGAVLIGGAVMGATYVEGRLSARGTERVSTSLSEPQAIASSGFASKRSSGRGALAGKRAA